jgi:hypothetical protein
MLRRSLAMVALVALACEPADLPVALDGDSANMLASQRTTGMRRVDFPGADPGPPLYVRVTPMLNQIFIDAGLVAIPFYRDPSCIPADTDLLLPLHPPGPGGRGAFGCALLVSGSYTIEADAPMGTFTRGPAQVWFVDVAAFEAATRDGVLTMAELIGLNPLRGTATSFEEMLAPRIDNHHVVISSHGVLEDGRTFRFQVNHFGSRTNSIMIRIR